MTSFDVVRRQWWVIVLALVLTCTAALIYIALAAPTYRATAKIVVGQGGVLPAPQLATSQPLTQTMSELLQSQTVATRAATIASLDTRPEQILDHLSVSNRPDAAVLVVDYKDSSRQRAVRTLSALSRAFVAVVSERLGTGAGTDTQVPARATIFDAAHALDDPVAPRPLLAVGAALVAGLGLGLLLATLREGPPARQSLNSPRDLSSPVISLQVSGTRTDAATSGESRLSASPGSCASTGRRVAITRSREPCNDAVLDQPGHSNSAVLTTGGPLTIASINATGCPPSWPSRETRLGSTKRSASRTRFATSSSRPVEAPTDGPCSGARSPSAV